MKSAHERKTQKIESAIAARLLFRALKRQVPADAIAWLTAEIDGVHAARDVRRLSIAVAGARRKMGRADLEPFPEDLAAARRGCPGWQPQLLSVDEAARILLLLSSRGPDGAGFASTIERLCTTASVEEHVAYLKGFAIFPDGQRLVPAARNAVRSSTSAIFEAIASNNSYPFFNFDTDAWNQMVVKCVFVGVAMETIYGLNDMRNPELIQMLADLVTERRLAGRPLPEAVLKYVCA